MRAGRAFAIGACRWVRHFFSSAPISEDHHKNIQFASTSRRPRRRRGRRRILVFTTNGSHLFIARLVNPQSWTKSKISQNFSWQSGFKRLNLPSFIGETALALSVLLIHQWLSSGIARFCGELLLCWLGFAAKG